MSDLRIIGRLFSFAILFVLAAAVLLVLADVGEPGIPDSDLAVGHSVKQN